MQVDGLKLVPAAAWDAERLSTYRNGSTVNVVITQEKAGWRQRKYWAILNAVVKTCPVRQRRAEDLHKAIRLKLGIVDSFTTFGGATKVELRSTTSMGEQEFEAFYHEAMDLLRAETGVDVETLNKESADVGRDEEQEIASPAGETVQSAQDEAMEPASTTSQLEVDVGSQQSASGGPTEEGAAPSTGLSPSSKLSEIKHMVMQECIDNMLRDAMSIPVDDAKAKVETLRATFLEPQNLADYPDFVNRCAETATRIIGKPAEKARAREYLIGKVPA
jgi:hypothetical protein